MKAARCCEVDLDLAAHGTLEGAGGQLVQRDALRGDARGEFGARGRKAPEAQVVPRGMRAQLERRGPHLELEARLELTGDRREARLERGGQCVQVQPRVAPHHERGLAEQADAAADLACKARCGDLDADQVERVAPPQELPVERRGQVRCQRRAAPKPTAPETRPASPSSASSQLARAPTSSA